MKRIFVSVTLCFLWLVLAAPAGLAADNWTSVRTKNFFLIGNASEKEIRQVADRLEQFREVASYLFSTTNFNSPVPTRVVVFKNDSSYRPFKPSATTAGYFQPGPDVNYITLKTEVANEENPFSVIFHEYTHLLVNNTSANVPTWFNEGLAEYYSTFTISDDQKIVIGKPIAQHIYLLRQNRLLPLKTLFTIDQESPYYNEREKQSIFYAQSWALMHFLILGNGGQRLAQLGKFVQLTENNVPVDEAFTTSFQTTYEKMESDLRKYVSNERYPMAAGHFERKLEYERQMKTAPLSEAEAQAYLGDLLLHSHRTDAEGYLNKALSLDPNLAIANASMGMLRVRQGRIDEARRSLERAVQASTDNYLIHYYYAFALSREGVTDAQLVMGYQPQTVLRIREELKKAIELRPDYPESYNLLAFVNVVTDSQLDESIAFLKKVLATSPGRNDLMFTLAQVYMHKHEFKAAREILERLSQIKIDQNLRQHAYMLLAQMKTMEEQVAALELTRKAGGADGNALPRIVSSADEPVIQPDPSMLLREALRKPSEGERQAQGALVRIDCDAKGIVFTVKVTDRQLRLHTDRFENVSLVSFSTEAEREITCGTRKQEIAVVVCYLPARDAGSRVDGTIKSLEFVPKDFKLNE